MRHWTQTKRKQFYRMRKKNPIKCKKAQENLYEKAIENYYGAEHGTRWTFCERLCYWIRSVFLSVSMELRMLLKCFVRAIWYLIFSVFISFSFFLSLSFTISVSRSRLIVLAKRELCTHFFSSFCYVMHFFFRSATTLCIQFNGFHIAQMLGRCELLVLPIRFESPRIDRYKKEQK